MVDSPTLPNAMVRATALGFRRAADRDLLLPYVQRYFDVIETLWEQRSFAIAEALVLGLYPSPLASGALAGASQQWLETHEKAPAALRRGVVENLAGVQRAVAAQQRDARP